MASLPDFTALPKREGLRAGVGRALRAAIISGEMQPGVVYSAPSLGTRFGVSATPVREAMLDLVKEGLVISVPNKGFRVTQVSESDLDEITDLRLLIEPRTVRSVVPGIPAADLPALRRLAQDIVDHAVAGDLIAYTEADRQFHLRLLEYSGNRRLVDLVSDLRSHTRLFGLAPLVEDGKLAESAAEHLELVDLIEAGDDEAAERLMVRHIGHVRGVWAGRADE
ncbi:MAG: GntR family transcriptional regulator [Nocardioidaceae bacterium]